ncbi:MAG: hypothetical protein ACI9BW_003980 [Gammaproteobacteria bacterium]|jgi:uncharacterized protein with NRDE domain
MCLLLAACQQHPDFRLIIAANRDEFYERPALPADFWPDSDTILGGRDLQGSGTWLAVNRRGAFAAITNVRTSMNIAAPRSRGLIISDYLTSPSTAEKFARELTEHRAQYQGFNVFASDVQSTAWCSNYSNEYKSLSAGVYGLSNHLLDTPWPKVNRIKADFKAVESLSKCDLIESLFSSLRNEESAPDRDLPNTGISIEHERVLSPIFISGDTYGTRCSTVILIDNGGFLTFIERRFGPRNVFAGESKFEFELEPTPAYDITESRLN